MKAKVFCIGFHKTGTTSLELALKKLGYRVTGSFGTKDPDIAGKVHDMAYAMVPEYDAFEDNPWPILYRELDERCGSRWIDLRLRERSCGSVAQRGQVGRARGGGGRRCDGTAAQEATNRCRQ